MGGKAQLELCLLLLAVCVSGSLAAKPLGGKFTGEKAIVQTLFVEKDAKSDEISPEVSCRALSLYEDATITLRMKGEISKKRETKAHVTISVTVAKSKCANFRDCKFVRDAAEYGGFVKNMSRDYYFSNIELDTKPEILIGHASVKAGGDDKATPHDTDKTTTDDSTDKGTSENTEAKRDDSASATTHSSTSSSTSSPAPTPAPSPGSVEVVSKGNTFRTNGSGLYIVYIETWIQEREINVNITFNLEMKNGYGYLSAIDYPSLVFYGLMTAVYAILGLAWSISMCCSYKDLVRLQFWVFAVIILGFLEKIFFVSEYSSINLGESSSLLILLAESISAVKRALARVLLIIVCLGFGTVKPRLGDSLMKVIAVGVIYCILAFIDGIVRSRTDTYDTGDKSQVVTLALLFIMDSIIFYWAFTSLVAVRRALRLRKNYVKLSMYNHFAYTLIFSLLATIAFTVWVFVEVNYPKGSCLEDWQEVWLRDCFWHFLFCVILVVIMIIWRPSANRNRFAYSLVNDLDQEEEEGDGMENKNFDTLKMRTISRGDAGTPPPVSTQAEDDLRWVEENLPTTAMDKALPLILDSDEEVMSTKFEASKLN